MIVQGLRSRRDIHAYRTFGLPGCSSTSIAPTLSDKKSTLRQVWPPSVVLNTPRSALDLNVSPWAETQTIFGSVGWMRTDPIWPALYRPINFQVWPPSVDL